MKSKTYFIYSCLTLILFSFLQGIPRANAGQSSIPGTTEESSSFAGDNFAPELGASSGVEIAPDTEASIGVDGRIVISEETRISLGRAISIIARENNSVSNQVILGLLTNINAGGDALQSQVQNSITSIGVSPISATNLVTSLFAMVNVQIANAPDSPDGETTPVGTITNPIDLISLQGVTINIDVNKLDAAISAYNKIVSESSPETLAKLSQDGNFRAIGRVLQGARQSMKNRNRNSRRAN